MPTTSRPTDALDSAPSTQSDDGAQLRPTYGAFSYSNAPAFVVISEDERAEINALTLDELRRRYFDERTQYRLETVARVEAFDEQRKYFNRQIDKATERADVAEARVRLWQSAAADLHDDHAATLRNLADKEGEVENMRRHIDELRRALHDERNRVNRERADVNMLAVVHAERDVAREDLERERMGRAADCANLRAAIHDVEQEAARLGVERDEARAELLELRRADQNGEAKGRAATVLLMGTAEKIEELTAERDAALAEVERLEAQRDEQRAAEMRAFLDAREKTERARQRDALDEAESNIKALNGLLEEARRERDALMGASAVMSDGAQLACKGAIATLTVERDDARREVEETRAAFDAAIQQLDDTRAEVVRLTLQQNSACEALRIASETVRNLTRERDALRFGPPSMEAGERVAVTSEAPNARVTIHTTGDIKDAEKLAGIIADSASAAVRDAQARGLAPQVFNIQLAPALTLSSGFDLSEGESRTAAVIVSDATLHQLAESKAREELDRARIGEVTITTTSGEDAAVERARLESLMKRRRLADVGGQFAKLDGEDWE